MDRGTKDVIISCKNLPIVFDVLVQFSELLELHDDQADGDDERERRRDHDELGTPERECGEQAHGGQAEVRHEPGRGDRGHVSDC